MSFSQKHSGKVLVPWFNKYEWKLVYDYIHSNDRESQLKALEILQIWKLRMPLLSAGIEGSLIILETLLIDKSLVKESQLNQIYALAFLRFLNVCATNNEKQGTFYKTAIENELPKWMISFRHDIAHSHKLPSLSILELCLNNCLNWLKEKYWKQQVDSINDYVHGQKNRTKDYRKTLKVLNAYLQVNYSCMQNKKINVESKNILEELNVEIGNKEEVLQKLRKLIRDEFRQELNDDVKEEIMNLLISEEHLLAPYWSFKKGAKNFIVFWNELFEILLENNLLPYLLNALLDRLNDSLQENDSHQEIASSWIYEIFLGLYNSKKAAEENEEIAAKRETNENGIDDEIEEESFSFKSQIKVSKQFLNTFLERILNNPSRFTAKFIRIVLLYNPLSNQNVSKNILKIIDIQNNATNIKQKNDLISDTIYTVDDLKEKLNFNFSNDDSSTPKTIRKNVQNKRLKLEDGQILHSVETEPFKGQWKIVKNTSIFKGCPLGILPNQRRDLNPQLLENMV